LSDALIGRDEEERRDVISIKANWKKIFPFENK